MRGSGDSAPPSPASLPAARPPPGGCSTPQAGGRAQPRSALPRGREPPRPPGGLGASRGLAVSWMCLGPEPPAQPRYLRSCPGSGSTGSAAGRSATSGPGSPSSPGTAHGGPAEPLTSPGRPPAPRPTGYRRPRQTTAPRATPATRPPF